jgi:hypothetical protein
MWEEEGDKDMKSKRKDKKELLYPSPLIGHVLGET